MTILSTFRRLSLALAALASVAGCSSSETTPGAGDDGEHVGETSSAVGIAVPQGLGLTPQKLYLTFDDGPSGTTTPQILKILSDHKGKSGPVKATFFITGVQIAGHEHLIKQELDEGHMVANHQWEHVQASTAQLQLWAPKEQKLLDPIFASADMADHKLYFRYPFGSGTIAKEAVLKADGYPLGGIGWNMDSLDWCYGGHFNATTNPGGACARPEALDKTNFVNHVKKHVASKHGNGVILFHDIQKITVFHLEELLTWFESQGFEFGGAFPGAKEVGQ